MRYVAVLVIITTLVTDGWSQRRTDLPFRKEGKWYYTLDNTTYGPFAWVSDLMKHGDFWLFISTKREDSKGREYFAYTNADGAKEFGPYDYINYRVAGFSPTGKHFYFMGFKGNKETANQQYFFIVNGKPYGPFTNVTRKIRFFSNDDIWTFKAVRDGKFRGRWHVGGKTRLYVMGKEYDVLKKPAGFRVESATPVSGNRYKIEVQVDVGSRQQIKTIYHSR
jgi:hypothetical protein